MCLLEGMLASGVHLGALGKSKHLPHPLDRNPVPRPYAQASTDHYQSTKHKASLRPSLKERGTFRHRRAFCESRDVARQA